MIFEKAKWLDFNIENDSVHVRSLFSVCNYKKVTIRIIGLGFFNLYLNGKDVTGKKFNQLFSNFNKRDLTKTFVPQKDDMSNRIYYNEYDVTNLAKNGKNCMAVTLGNGWYRHSDRYCEGDYSFSKTLKLIYEIEVDGKVIKCSDGTEKYSENHIRKSTLYNGEHQDFNFEVAGFLKTDYFDLDWKNAPICEVDKVPLYKADCPVDSVVKKFKPKIIYKKGDVTVYDCGITKCGYVEFTAKTAQSEINLEYAEEYKGKGELVLSYEGQDSGESQFESYKNVPKNKKCAPEFTFYGFRYVKVVGNVKNLKVVHVFTNLDRATNFNSSSKLLNWYNCATITSMQSNLHMGIEFDCPQREKYGYTGDCLVSCETILFNFNAKKFYEKWIGDIADCQNSVNGYITNTAPYMGGGGGPAWGLAIVEVPYQLYKKYHDKSIYEKYYKNMEKYFYFLISNQQDGLLSKPDWDTAFWLGDWSFPSKDDIISERYVATCLFVKYLRIYKDICSIINVTYPQDFIIAEENAKKAIIENFYDEKTGSFIGGKSGADLFAIAIGLGDERTKNNVIEKYSKKLCFDTGIFGTKMLFEFLTKENRPDLVYKLMTSTKYPSFGWWKEQGATSLWEDWCGNFFTWTTLRSSQNHHMFGASQIYIFRSLLGINVNEKDQFIVEPPFVDGLNEIEGTVKIGSENYVNVKVVNGKKRMVIVKTGKLTTGKLIVCGVEYSLNVKSIIKIKV